MSASWGFAVETSIHALRLGDSGLFDEHPTLKTILGHPWEFIPFGRMSLRIGVGSLESRGGESMS